MGNPYGHYYQKARKAMLTQAAAQMLPCALCGRPLDYTLKGTHKWGPTADHTTPVALGGGTPRITPDQLRPAHKHCQSRQGNRVSRRNKPPRTPRNVDNTTNPPVTPLSMPTALTPAPHNLTPPPLESGAPRFESGPHPLAVGSLADEAIPVMEARLGRPLLDWQVRVLRRGLEVDAEGRLVWRQVIVSTPRQQGKSWLIRELAVWRAEQGSRFGNDQELVLHVSRVTENAKEIMAGAYGWAIERGLKVYQARGSEEIRWPDGSAWRARAYSAVYGASASLALVDECWDVPRSALTRGLEPTLAARNQSQLWMFSTAHPQATDLLLKRRALAVEGGPDAPLMLDWGAVPDDDFADPGVWRRVTPAWDALPNRESLIRSAFAEDPADARSQYLNTWPDETDAGRWVPSRFTQAAQIEWPDAVPSSAWCGVEVPWVSESDQGRWGVVFAWADPTGLITAKVLRVDTLDDVVAAVGSRRVVCHASTVNQLQAAGKRTRVEGVNTAKGRAATEVLGKVLKSRRVRVDGISDETWAAVRVTPADGGVTIDGRRSAGDVSTVKALAWAVWQIEVARHAGFTLVAG